jgi:hypothetical protein
MNRTELIHFVANQAMLNFQQLSFDERIKLLTGLQLILDPAGAEQAEHLAFMLEKAEQHQLKFRELLKS